MLILSNDDVKAVLDMSGTMEALRKGYDDLKRGEATYGPRIDYYLPTGRDGDYYQWGNMVGACASYGVVAVRMKSDVASWPQGKTQEKYCVRPGLFCGLIMLFSSNDGAPLAIVQDGYLQHMRVGGSMGIGVDLLSRKDATTVGMLGSGGMARSFLESFAEARPIDKVKVFSPTKANREAYASEMSDKLGIDVESVNSAEEAVRDTLIVSTATDSMVPTFDSDWIAPGAHVVCVTRRELGKELIARADVVVQLGYNTIPYGTPVPMVEWKAGGIASYVAGKPADRARIPDTREESTGVYPTMLDVEAGNAPGRTSDDQVTLFVGTGTQGLQFAAVCGRVYQEAKKKGLGHELPVDWFLQDIRD
ncbi:MAG: ornithine cyclodeaminase family protein [Actinomycetota bacterium]|nr:ornithine cyclodeaminase family protein [Actinomycetota bacterium]